MRMVPQRQQSPTQARSVVAALRISSERCLSGLAEGLTALFAGPRSRRPSLVLLQRREHQVLLPHHDTSPLGRVLSAVRC